MINKTSLIKGLFKEKNKDYTYMIIFILVLCFFIIIIIKPSLGTVFSLKQKLAELKSVDGVFEKEIIKIVDLQKKIEIIRDDLYLLTDAVPESAKVNKIINDIKYSLDKNNMVLTTMGIQEVSLKKNISQKEINLFKVNLESKGNFKDGLGFIKELKSQRRLKDIKALSIERDNSVGTSSSQLLFRFQIESYYL